MKYTFLGHACFTIDTGKDVLLFDPFLTGNGQAAVMADEVKAEYPAFPCTWRPFRRCRSHRSAHGCDGRRHSRSAGAL